MTTEKVKELYINCPHCSGSIIIAENEINCAIFRHGSYKSDNQQINPHLDKESCDKLFKENKINGCGKPFKLVKTDNEYVAEICDYI